MKTIRALSAGALGLIWGSLPLSAMATVAEPAPKPPSSTPPAATPPPPAATPPPPAATPPPPAMAPGPGGPAPIAAPPPSGAPGPGYPGSAHPPQSESSQATSVESASGYRLALGTQGAFGLTHQSFYNQLVTARFDRRFSERFALGAALSYANLRGKDGRAHNILPAVQFEFRPELGKGWYLPLRYVLGYLPKNGPYTQLSLGLGTDLSEKVELHFDIVAPTIWLTDDLPVTSMNVGVELAYRL